jgi:hypothetical protein
VNDFQLSGIASQDHQVSSAASNGAVTSTVPPEPNQQFVAKLAGQFAGVYFPACKPLREVRDVAEVIEIAGRKFFIVVGVVTPRKFFECHGIAFAWVCIERDTQSMAAEN